MKRSFSKIANQLLLVLLIISSFTFLFTGCQSSSTSTSPIPSSVESVSPSATPAPTEQAQIANSTAQTKTDITKNLTIHFIDVGQADSIFIELPNDETMLIDAGNNADGDNVVAYINGLGYDTINYLIATHPHEDHIGGMAYVVDNINIESVYMPKAQNDTRTFEDLLQAIQNKGLTINTAKAGISIIDIDNLKVGIIAPNSDSYDDLNDYSAVIKLTYKNNSFLFMGDAETLSENEITADVNADVLKIGHHGSSSSTSEVFLNKVSPKYAIISVGADNSYGHPATETTEKLDNVGAIVYRTDQDGTIVFTSDGSNISVDKTPAKTVAAAATTPPVIVATPPPTPQPTTAATPAPTDPPPQIEEKEVTVYITKTGEKYHSDGCQYLSKSKIAISLDDAKAEGYTPCSKCNPPR